MAENLAAVDVDGGDAEAAALGLADQRVGRVKRVGCSFSSAQREKP